MYTQWQAIETKGIEQDIEQATIRAALKEWVRLIDIFWLLSSVVVPKVGRDAVLFRSPSLIL